MIDPARMTSTNDLRIGVEAVVCDRCQGECWQVEVWGHDVAGSGQRACWAFRPHIQHQSAALDWAARILSGSARRLETLEAARWALEHQLTLGLEGQ